MITTISVVPQIMAVAVTIAVGRLIEWSTLLAQRTEKPPSLFLG